MKITLTGSLGHINSQTVPSLIAAGHDVTVITSNPERTEVIEALGAQAAVGTITDASFLTQTFSGADAVYLMLTGMDPSVGFVQFGAKQGAIYRQALDAAHVPYAVVLSSVGADQGPEVGALYAYHLMEDELRRAQWTRFTFLRPVGFFSNLLANTVTIRTQHALINNYSEDTQSAWTDPRDIARTALKAFKVVPTQNQVRYVLSQWLIGTELIAQLRVALNLPDLHWVTMADEAMQTSLEKAGMSKKMASEMMQMRAAQRDSRFYADLRTHEPEHGTVRLTDIVPALRKALG